MQMSYRKALDIVKHAEECFGQPLLDRAGGRHGEDSEFTEFGSRLVERFSQIESDIDGYAEGQFRALLAYCNGAVETE
jgi:molybdate transport repressor ModE-like protein